MTTYNVGSGVTTSGRVLSTGDFEYINGGGRSISTTIKNGGQQSVNSGGFASTTTLLADPVTGARQDIYSGGRSSATVVNYGGIQAINSGGQAYGTIVNGGGSQIVNGGYALNATINGTQSIQSFGTASASVVNSGGNQIVSSGEVSATEVKSGGTQLTNAGGIARGTVVRFGGTETLSGTAYGTVLLGGTQTLQSGGVASGTVISAGGRQIVYADNTALSTILYQGASVDLAFLPYTIAGMASLSASNMLTITEGARTYKQALGAAPLGPLALVNDGIGGTLLVVGATSVTSGFVVTNGATQIVGSGTDADGTIINFGGTEIISSGGMAIGTVISAGGVQVVSSGALSTGTVLHQGATIDLRFLPYTDSGTISVNASNVLTVTEGTQTYTQSLGSAPIGQLKLSADGVGGTLVSTTGFLPASISVDQGGNSLGVTSDYIQKAMKQALAEWGQYLGTYYPLQILIKIAPTKTGTANASSLLQQVDFKYNGSVVTSSQAQLAISFGDHYSGPDITVTIDSSYLKSLYFSPDPTSSNYKVPADKIDGVSLFVHELAHAFGFFGQLDQNGASFGSLSLFDTLIRKNADGSAYFTGSQAQAVYGGPVPLTTTNSPNDENYYHLGNSRAGTLAKDVMSGYGLTPGVSYKISALDVAILRDVYVPMDRVGSASLAQAEPLIPVRFSTQANPPTSSYDNRGTIPPWQASLSFTNYNALDTLVNWQYPIVINGKDSTTYRQGQQAGPPVQVQLWLTQAPYAAGSVGVEILETDTSETFVGKGVALPPSGSYYATGVLVEFDSASSKFVQEDTISYGRFNIVNPNPDSSKINWAPSPPDSSDGGGSSSDSGNGSGGGDGTGGGTDNGGGSDTRSGGDTPIVTVQQPAKPDVWDPVNARGTPVYRLFDTVHGTQFLTSSQSERDSILATRTDLTDEGVGLDSIPDFAVDTKATPVFRFFDTIYGTHFYSASADERSTIIATRPDLAYEGAAFNEYVASQPGTAPVYRFFESTNGTHFFTGSESERANILQTRPDLLAEGVAFYSPKS